MKTKADRAAHIASFIIAFAFLAICACVVLFGNVPNL